MPFAITAALLAPLWMVPHLPLVDYPNHLARTFILAHLDDPAFRFPSYYDADWGLGPYMLMDASLVTLQKFLPAEAAGRLFLTLSVVAMPLAVWFFLRQANPGQDHLALWSLLFPYNFFFLMGFMNMNLSVLLCFLALGLWLRGLARPRPGQWLLLLLVVTLLYFAHIVGFLVAGLAMSAHALRERRSLRELAATGLAFVPGMLLLLSSGLVASGRQPAVFLTLDAKGLSPLLVLESYSPRLDLLTSLVICACVIAAWWRNQEFRWNRRWLEVCFLLYSVYWLLPFGYGNVAYVDSRFLLFLSLMALAGAHAGARARRLVPVALLLFALRVGDVALQFCSLQPQLDGLAGALAVIPKHARILPLVEDAGERPPFQGYAHFWAYGVIEKGWFSPYLFHDPGVHPLALTSAAYYPRLHGYLPTVYGGEPDWRQVQRDYQYVWAHNVPQFSPRLQAIGSLVYQDGRLQVFRLHPPPAAP